MNKLKYPFRCVFKNRQPDPGMCTVISINFEEQKLVCSNGIVNLYPSFEEVNFYQSTGISLQTNEPYYEKVKL